MQLEAYSGTHANAVECLLPEHYRHTPLIGQYIIERLEPPPANLIFYLKIKNISSETPNLKGVYLYELYLGLTTKIIPEPDKPLSWRYADYPHLQVETTIPNNNWAIKLGMHIAMGIVVGMLPLPVQKDDEAQKIWETIINNTVDNMTGLNIPTGLNN